MAKPLHCGVPVERGHARLFNFVERNGWHYASLSNQLETISGVEKRWMRCSIPTACNAKGLDMKILHLDSSVLGPHSVSRLLSAELVDALKSQYPVSAVTYHDLAADPVLHLSPAHLAAFQGGSVEDPELGADLARGGAYLDELFEADAIVIGAPMYNFSVPTQLKAWIDRVVVAGKTFRYTETGPVGLVPTDKKVFIIASHGGIYADGSPAAPLDFSERYLVTIFRHIGLTNIEIIRAEGVNMGPDHRDQSIGRARRQIGQLTSEFRKAA